MSQAKTLNAKTQQALQHHLLQAAADWQKFIAKHPQLELASYHIYPDGTHCSIEHEETVPPARIIRLSPACHTILTKL